MLLSVRLSSNRRSRIAASFFGSHGSSTSAEVSKPFKAAEAMIAAAASPGRWRVSSSGAMDLAGSLNGVCDAIQSSTTAVAPEGKVVKL
jgi:hypothetical protein